LQWGTIRDSKYEFAEKINSFPLAAVHPLYYLLRKAFKNGARLNLKGATKQLRSN
jgi:hypothetical protein